MNTHINRERLTQCVELANELLDAATSNHHDTPSGETFTECHMCHQWEDHEDWCPVPALEKWMNRPDPTD